MESQALGTGQPPGKGISVGNPGICPYILHPRDDVGAVAVNVINSQNMLFSANHTQTKKA